LNNDNLEKDERRIEKEKNSYYSEICSEVIEGLLYVSSYMVAKNEDLLMDHNITHIVNAAADVCENHFPHKIDYLHYFLKDHNIEVRN